MTKKEILAVFGILVFIVGLSGGGYLFWNHYEQFKNSQTVSAATPASNDIALNQAAPVSNDTSGLKVDTSLNTSNPAQLGSGQKASTSSNSSSSGSAANAPGPESFGQYDQYKSAQNALFGDIQVGTGNEVKAGDKIAVIYKGWLTNGTLFDESKVDSSGQQQPFTFTVGSHQVIPGFEQDAVGMKVGGTRRFIIPPAAGYGSKAQGSIPANSVLVFDVQLVAIQ